MHETFGTKLTGSNPYTLLYPLRFDANISDSLMQLLGKGLGILLAVCFDGQSAECKSPQKSQDMKKFQSDHSQRSAYLSNF
jgi:hypothetical protein